MNSLSKPPPCSIGRIALTVCVLALSGSAQDAWEWAASAPIDGVPTAPLGEAHDVAISPDGSKAVLHASGDAVRIVDAVTGASRGSLPSPGIVRFGASEKCARSVAATNDRAIVIGGDPGVVSIYDISKNPATEFASDDTAGLRVKDVAVTDRRCTSLEGDGEVAVVVFDYGSGGVKSSTWPTGMVRVYSMNTGAILGTFPGAGPQFNADVGGPVRSVEVTIDRAVVIGCTTSPPDIGMVRILDLVAVTDVTPAPVNPLNGSPDVLLRGAGGGFDVAITPDGTKAVVATDGIPSAPGLEAWVEFFDLTAPVANTASLPGAGQAASYHSWPTGSVLAGKMAEMIAVTDQVAVITGQHETSAGSANVIGGSVAFFDLGQSTPQAIPCQAIGLSGAPCSFGPNTLGYDYCEMRGRPHDLAIGGPSGDLVLIHTDWAVQILDIGDPQAISHLLCRTTPGTGYLGGLQLVWMPNSIVANSTRALVVGNATGPTIFDGSHQLFDLTAPGFPTLSSSNPSVSPFHEVALNPAQTVAGTRRRTGSLEFFDLVTSVASAIQINPGALGTSGSASDDQTARSLALTNSRAVDVGTLNGTGVYSVYAVCGQPFTSGVGAQHSPGSSATIGWSGTTSYSASIAQGAPDPFTLECTNLPLDDTGNSSALFFYGGALLSCPVPFYQGTLYVQPPLGRNIQLAQYSQGSVSVTPDLASLQNIQVGDERHFQLLYRYSPPSGGTESYTSDVLTVCFGR